MQFELPDDLGAATLDVERRLSDDEYFELCASNPDVRIEREPRGEIVIMPPTGFESGCRNSEIAAQLTN